MQRLCSSDYITALKQQAIYNTNKSNAVNFKTVNPLKTNGFRYNRDWVICQPTTCTTTDCSGGVLTTASSYENKQDFNAGKQWTYVRCLCPQGQTCYLCRPCAFR